MLTCTIFSAQSPWFAAIDYSSDSKNYRSKSSLTTGSVKMTVATQQWCAFQNLAFSMRQLHEQSYVALSVVYD